MRLRRNEEIPWRIVKVLKTASKLIEGFNRIRGLADDLFCTGDIQTIDYALEVYEQYVRNEDFDPFLYNSFEINLKVLRPELEKFYKNLEKFTPRLIKFLKYAGYKGHLIDMSHKIEKTFFEYLEEQFIEVIVLTLFKMGFLMYVKRMGWGKITPPGLFLIGLSYQAYFWYITSLSYVV